MTENEQESQGEQKPTTSPKQDNPAEANHPPGNGDLDEQAVEQGRDKLDQAGGGH